MGLFEICYNDLTSEAQKRYRDYYNIEDESDINTEIPIAILEAPNAE